MATATPKSSFKKEVKGMVSFINRKVLHLIMAVVLALSMILVSPATQASAEDMAHQVTNVNNLSFTISWVTSATATGSVNYGTSSDSLDSTAYDDRGQATEDDTHYVPIAGLTASTPYYYEIVSGGVTYNNSGVPYEITTGPGLDFKMPDPITGTAYKADGVTAAEGTIIYISIDTSQILSVLVGSSGAWGMDIGAIRAADYQSYYAHSDSDNITIEAQGGADGTASQVVTIATAKAGAPAMTLAVALTANFSADVTAASVGETIQFTNATSGGTPDYTYEWDFNNDGTVDNTEASPTHAYTSTGTYTVSLTVTDSETSTDTETKTDYISVAEELVAGFSADVTAASVDGTIQFTDATTGGAPDYTYEWDFNNDGTVDNTEASPTHAYTSTGTYTVSLTVTDSQARTDTETKTDYINVAEELVAGFSADLTAADTGDTIQFTDATTGGTPDYTYEWDFNNDGTVDNTEASPTHIYTTAGTYTVSLTVTDSQARTDTETKTDYVNIITELVAGFSADTTVANVDSAIQFTDATTGGAPDYTYEWDFNNDGTVDSTEASPSHAYTSIGTYTVSLTVTDSQTRTDTETKASYINVAEELVIDFSADVTIANVDDIIQFTSAAAGGTPDYSYEWDFDNDGTVDSTEANPSHTYTSAGTYSVSLTVTDSQARTCIETKTDYINAAEELVAGFSADVTAADVGGVIQFTDATGGGAAPYTYEWDFNNDGTVDSTEASPTHIYTTAGTYTVSLKVIDSLARTDTETKTDYINAAAVGMPHQVTNVGNISLAITWVTDAAETGHVNYGTSASSLDNTAYDDRGQATEDDTHYVPIAGLTASTPYYYEIVSGGVTYNNVGAPYEITTGPILDFMMPDPITGTVYKADGITAAEGTIVYVSIGTSQTLSVLVDSSGACGLDIAAIRAADYQSYYTYSDDDSGSFRANGGADGMAIQTATIATAKSGTLTIELTPAPTTDFSADETAVNAGDIIQFTDATTDGVAPYTCEWDFNNDGTVDSTEANPSYAYTSAGTYSVSLTITDSLARTDAETKASYITVAAVPSSDSDTYVPPPKVVEEIPPDRTAEELEGMNAEEAADIIEETTTTKAADIIEEISTDKAADIIEEVTTTKAADIIEETTATKAADIIEEISTDKAADIIEEVTTNKADDIIEEVTTTKATDIIKVVTTTKAAEIIQGVTTSKAANIIKGITITKTANIIERVTTTKAADIIEEVTTSKAADIIEGITIEKAAAVMEEVSTDTLNDLVGEMSEESLMDTLPEMSTDTLHSVDVETLFDALPSAPTEQLTSEEPPEPPADLTDPIVRYATPSGAQYVAVRTEAGEWVVVIATPEPLDKLMIKTDKALTDVETTVQILDEQPPEVTVGLPTEQIAMKYINISFENATPEDIDLGHLAFHVANEWLEQNSVHKWSMVLSRYDPELGQWISLPTKRIGEDDTYVYYTVVITRFSTFAISGSRVVPPLKFTATNLVINPIEAETGEDITISADITNLSNTAGAYTVTLWIDGTVEAGKDVSLEAGETAPVSFTVIGDAEGTYQVRLDRLFGSFNIIEAQPAESTEPAEPTEPIAPTESTEPAEPTEPSTPTTSPEPPFNWWLIVGIIAGVIIVTVSIFVPLGKGNRAL